MTAVAEPRATARERTRQREHEREQRDDQDVLRDRHAEDGTGNGTARIELVHQRHGQGRRRCGGDRPQHERHGDGVAEGLVHGEREPGRDGERDEGDEAERHEDRPDRQPREHAAIATYDLE